MAIQAKTSGQERVFWLFFNQLKSAGKCLIKTDNKHQGYKENFQRVGIAKLEMLKIDLTVSNRASDTLTFTRPFIVRP